MYYNAYRFKGGSSMAASQANGAAPVDFRTEPSQYKHWKLSIDGAVATLAMDVREDGGLRPGYELKLNSYDLGVDIELHDVVQRLRFEHPEVRSVVITSAKERIFCAGAEDRSEEHTSELQSLMRISYAVFCLKKKTK